LRPNLKQLIASAALAAFMAVSLTRLGADTNDLLRYVYPLAKARPAPPVTVDTSDAPEAQPWAEMAADLVRNWFPHICQLLSTAAYEPPREIRLVFKKELNVPAYASGSTITVSAKWIHDHPNDLGAVIHELTHVVQAYPPSRQTPSWLVEGVADYVRWWRYEPEARRTRIDPQKASYRDSYRTAAAFLAWLTEQYDKRLVPKLDAAMRSRTDPIPVFNEVCGRQVDDLWTEFTGTLTPR
jgi:hypothetical protein